MERLGLEEQYNHTREQWLRDDKIDMVVDEEDIGRLVAQWTGIPVNQMLEEEAERLLHMEERLHQRIIGQDTAIRMRMKAAHHLVTALTGQTIGINQGLRINFKRGQRIFRNVARKHHTVDPVRGIDGGNQKAAGFFRPFNSGKIAYFFEKRLAKCDVGLIIAG